MDEKILGSITLLCIISSFCGSFLCYKKSRFNSAVFLIMLAGLLLRLYLGTNFTLHPWDERYHALVAKNLINHPLVPTLYDTPILDYNYKDWTANHVWLHKPPLALWLMALSMFLFGINEIALRLPSLILSTTGIFLTYSIGAHLFSKKTGLIAAFFHSINLYLMLPAMGFNPTDHVDTIFFFFVELGIFLSVHYTIRKKNYFILLIGVVTGLAILTKWLTGLLILPIWAIFALKSERWEKVLLKFIIMLLISFVIFMPWQTYIHITFPKEFAWEMQYNARHLDEALERHEGSAFFHINHMALIYGAFIYLPIIWFLALSMRKKINFDHLGIALWFLFPYVFFSFVATKMMGYCMVSSPAIFLMQAYCCAFLTENPFDQHPKSTSLTLKYNTLTSALLFLIVAPVLSTTSLEYTKRFSDQFMRNPYGTQKIREINEQFPNGKYVFCNTENAIEIMFYTPYLAYKNTPTEKQQQQLIDAGYQIIMRKQK